MHGLDQIFGLADAHQITRLALRQQLIANLNHLEHRALRLADRQSHAEWEAAGSRSMLDRASEQLQEILASHEPAALPADRCQALDEILAEAEASYRQQGAM